MKKRRRLWCMVHKWIGLVLGLIFALLGLTGSINVFHIELEELRARVISGASIATAPAGIDLDQVLQTIRTAYPDRQGRWVLMMPGYGSAYLWAVYPRPRETTGERFAPLRVLIDPATGRVAGEHFWGRTIWTLLYELHVSLLVGRFSEEAGEGAARIVSLLGLALVCSLLTGVVLWWPRNGWIAMRLAPRQRPRRRINFYRVHVVTGLWFAPVLLILAVTGFSFGYQDNMARVLRWMSPVSAQPFRNPMHLHSVPQEGVESLSLSAAVAVAKRALPDGELRWISVPGGPNDVYAIEMRQVDELNRRRPRSKVWIDRYSGDILAIEDPNRFTMGERILNMMWPLHTGEALGLAGRILWCVTGIAPLALYISSLRFRVKSGARRSL